MSGPTRRDVLAGLGTAAASGLAGCTALDEDDSPPRFDAGEMEVLLSEPTPDVERPAPVQPTADAIDAGLDRCADLLATVPASISADDVPNGVVRAEIETARERAVEKREAVETAADRFRALQSLRDARRDARETATAFAAVDEELVADVEAERKAVRTAVETRLARIEYEGEDPARTLLLAVRLEEFLTHARRRIRRGFRTRDPGVLDVGELAGNVEFASATLDAVDHLAERRATTDPNDFTTVYEAALESSLHSLSRADVPGSRTTPEELLGAEIERRDVEFLLGEALRTVRGQDDRIATEFDEGRLATGLDRALALERDVRALRTVVERVTREEFPELETIEQVRTEREAALDAAAAVPVAPSEPSLAGDVVVRTLVPLQWPDRQIERSVDHGSDARLDREYAQYAYYRARLEALPAAIETVRERLGID